MTVEANPLEVLCEYVDCADHHVGMARAYASSLLADPVAEELDEISRRLDAIREAIALRRSDVAQASA